VRRVFLQKPGLSSLAGCLDAELEAWRSRRLEAEAYPYLFVDARYEKVRVGGAGW
jgi:transposase-like protein